ncbi:unnamed protein product [Mytilus edulis]|uniref:Uncharacterized protein n=1 Tax=Mytilus edulis TaxID=6550 RepID=A0A8S3RAS2_MYTED|nr:unnamed protein product [Mytilus edulis]
MTLLYSTPTCDIAITLFYSAPTCDISLTLLYSTLICDIAMTLLYSTPTCDIAMTLLYSTPTCDISLTLLYSTLICDIAMTLLYSAPTCDIAMTLFTQHQHYGQTPLMLAAERGHLEVVMYLVSQGSQLEATSTDHDGMTPLMLAAERGHLEVVMYLASQGSQLEATDTLNGYTALHHAAGNGHIDVTKWLIDQGCSPWVKTKQVIFKEVDIRHTLPQSKTSLFEEVDIAHTLPQSNVTVSEEVDIAHTLPQSNVSSSGTVYILERTVTVTDRSRTTKPSDENTGKEDADKVVFYASSVGLIVLAFFIGMLLKGVQNKYCSGQNVSEEKNDEIQHSAEELQEIYSYEAIDELQITDQNQGSVPPRLPVPRSFVQHKNDHRDLKVDQNGIRKENHRYLNPYQPIQEANIYEHEYMPINAEITTNKPDNDQLHPYNFLLKHDMSEDHEYKYLGNTSTKSELPEKTSAVPISTKVLTRNAKNVTLDTRLKMDQCVPNVQCHTMDSTVLLNVVVRVEKFLQEKEDDGQVIYYAGSAGLFVIVILLRIILYRVKNKCSHRQRVSRKKKHESFSPAEETIEMDRSESIDELHLEDLNLKTVHSSLSVRRYFVQQQCNVNLDTHYRDSMKGQNEIRMEDEGYLNSYQPIQEANIYKHEYEAIGVLNITKEDYIHTTHC